MMKKLFLLAGALVVLAACGNNDELPAPVQEQEPITIDLRTMNYEGVMNLLSEQTSLNEVTFVDGDIVKTVSLMASGNLDAEQAGQLTFDAPKKDSLDLMVTPECVAVRMNVDGKRMAYMTFADPNQQNEIIGLYEEMVPTTRGGVSAVTRSVDGEAFSLNLTEIADAMQTGADAGGTYALPERELKYQSSAATRGWFSNLFKKVVATFSPKPAPVVKTPTIDIYLLKEKGANPLEHEMKWQVNDAIESLKDIQSNVKFNVYIKDCSYGGVKNSDITAAGFRKWMETSPYAKQNGIYVLCRWGGWHDLLGWDLSSEYKVNTPEVHLVLSATNAWNKYTMAHEIGHAFGAWHVNASWWQSIVPFTSDLMCTPSFDWMSSGKHKDNANRAVIKKNLTLN